MSDIIIRKVVALCHTATRPPFPSSDGSMIPAHLLPPKGRYEGSRQDRVRFSYSKGSWAGFIEMSREWSEGEPKDVIRKFRQALLAAPGVTQVGLHPKGSKTKQGNPGVGHYQDTNFAVRTKRTGPRISWSLSSRGTATRRIP